MAIDFPASPINGQTFTAAGVQWTFDGTKWAASSFAYLPLAGGTLTGALNGTTANFSGLAQAASPPVADNSLDLATTSWVNANAKGSENRIINGNFAINQRAQVSGTALAAAAYGHDRWKAGTGGCTYTFTAAVPDTTITITAGTLTQIIEAGMIEGGVYTLSWTGTAQARVYQGTPTGAYAASPVVTASLPAGVNTIVEFNTGTVVRAKFEIGSVATPYNRQSLAKSMADCQRYYQKIGGTVAFDIIIQAYANAASSSATAQIAFPSMRAAPTVTAVGGFSIGNCTVSFFASLQVLSVQLTATAAGNVSWYNDTTAKYLTLSAEL